MTKRHQANRRKNYGRRQHELHERRQRDHVPSADETGFEDLEPSGMVDRFGFLEPRSPRLHYVLGD